MCSDKKFWKFGTILPTPLGSNKVKNISVDLSKLSVNCSYQQGITTPCYQVTIKQLFACTVTFIE